MLVEAIRHVPFPDEHLGVTVTVGSVPIVTPAGVKIVQELARQSIQWPGRARKQEIGLNLQTFLVRVNISVERSDTHGTVADRGDIVLADLACGKSGNRHDFL